VIRSGRGLEQGERTDIHVDAVTRGPKGKLYNVLTVIIEVKGCWNKNLNTDMEEQLVKRYLKENSCRYGLYLIAWFYCDLWDPRSGRAPKMGVNEAQQYFDTQAMTLSQQDSRVRVFVMNTGLR